MLNAAQIEARRGKLTASVVRPLMTGDGEAVMRLWRIMIGEEQEENLDHVWAVRMGEVTEQLQLDWFEQKNRVPVTRRGEVVVHRLHDCFAATIDGFVSEYGYPIEAKFVLSRDPLEVVIEKHQPQLHWQMCCCNTAQCALTISLRGDEPVVEFIDMDHAYAGELMRRGLQFMEFVRKRMPPVILPPASLPVSKWIDYPMAGNDTWRRYADQWIQTQGAVKSCEEAAKVLKSLVPSDARKCWGDGVRISRDRAGRLSLRIDDDQHSSL